MPLFLEANEISTEKFQYLKNIISAIVDKHCLLREMLQLQLLLLFPIELSYLSKIKAFSQILSSSKTQKAKDNFIEKNGHNVFKLVKVLA